MVNGNYRIILAFSIGVLVLTGCGGLQKARYFKLSLSEETYKSKEWGSGLAVVADKLCVFVSEGASADYRLYSYGPIGLPLLPVDAFGSDRARPNNVEFSIWIVPGEYYEGYSFDPKMVELAISNGEIKRPETVQISRFKTSWKKETVYMFTPDTVESISRPEHREPQPVEEIDAPVKLWNWSRFYISFEKLASNELPIGVHVKGLFKDEKTIEYPILALKDTEKVMYVVSGQLVDGTPMGDTPATPCRELFGGN